MAVFCRSSVVLLKPLHDVRTPPDAEHPAGSGLFAVAVCSTARQHSVANSSRCSLRLVNDAAKAVRVVAICVY